MMESGAAKPKATPNAKPAIAMYTKGDLAPSAIFEPDRYLPVRRRFATGTPAPLQGRRKQSIAAKIVTADSG
jgi:hypothetical protein